MPMSSAEILKIRERQPRSINLNKKLNPDELQKSICAITGYNKCVLSKIAEGGFHRIYRAELAGGQNPASQVISRVAFDIPDFRNTRKMESEVATINWIKKNTSIPVPTVLFCDLNGHGHDGERNIGAPWMLMEKIPGRTLDRMWPDMSQSQREEVVKSLAGYTVELLRTRFSAIGSLFPGVNDETTLGPMIPTCNPWCFRTDATLDSGPWTTEKDYLLGCINRELHWISEHPADLNAKWPSDSSPDLAERYKSLLDKLSRRVNTLECLNSGSGPFVLRHPDLNPTNIMVREDDPSVVTAVLDWECANTAPTWAVAQVPEFLSDWGDDFEQDLTERASKARLREIFIGAIRDSYDIDVGSRRGKSLVALEEAVQTITTMRKIQDMDAIVSRVLTELAAAGL
ncbi:kinase-like domain-containing protein, partial [Mycena vulgaris]